MVTSANEQLAESEATFAPLLHIAQQVQLAGDFDANLKFAQLQHDSPQVNEKIQQTLLHSRRCFDVDSVRELEAWLPLWQFKRQSLILDADLVAQLAPLCKGLTLKVSITH